MNPLTDMVARGVDPELYQRDLTFYTSPGTGHLHGDALCMALSRPVRPWTAVPLTAPDLCPMCWTRALTQLGPDGPAALNAVQLGTHLLHTEDVLTKSNHLQNPTNHFGLLRRYHHWMGKTQEETIPAGMESWVEELSSWIHSSLQTMEDIYCGEGAREKLQKWLDVPAESAPEQILVGVPIFEYLCTPSNLVWTFFCEAYRSTPWDDREMHLSVVTPRGVLEGALEMAEVPSTLPEVVTLLPSDTPTLIETARKLWTPTEKNNIFRSLQNAMDAARKL